MGKGSRKGKQKGSQRRGRRQRGPRPGPRARVWDNEGNRIPLPPRKRGGKVARAFKEARERGISVEDLLEERNLPLPPVPPSDSPPPESYSYNSPASWSECSRSPTPEPGSIKRRRWDLEEPSGSESDSQGSADTERQEIERGIDISRAEAGLSASSGAGRRSQPVKAEPSDPAREERIQKKLKASHQQKAEQKTLAVKAKQERLDRKEEEIKALQAPKKRAKKAVAKAGPSVDSRALPSQPVPGVGPRDLPGLREEQQLALRAKARRQQISSPSSEEFREEKPAVAKPRPKPVAPVKGPLKPTSTGKPKSAPSKTEPASKREPAVGARSKAKTEPATKPEPAIADEATGPEPAELAAFEQDLAAAESSSEGAPTDFPSTDSEEEETPEEKKERREKRLALQKYLLKKYRKKKEKKAAEAEAAAKAAAEAEAKAKAAAKTAAKKPRKEIIV